MFVQREAVVDFSKLGFKTLARGMYCAGQWAVDMDCVPSAECLYHIANPFKGPRFKSLGAYECSSISRVQEKFLHCSAPMNLLFFSWFFQVQSSSLLEKAHVVSVSSKLISNSIYFQEL